MDDQITQQANTRYIRRAMNAPMLTQEHEQNLARQWKNDQNEKSLHELIQSYTRLVVSIAAKFKNYGLPLGDLIQEGNIGIMEAAARFDPERGFRFSTYATWWIRAQIQDYILRNWSIVRTGSTASQKKLFFNLRRLRAEISRQSPRDNMDDNAVDTIAEKLNVSTKDVIEMENRFNRGDQSLNAPLGEDGHSTYQDMMADTAPHPEEIVIGMRDNATRSKWLNDGLDTLSQRERTIIKERKMSNDIVTLETLGAQMGISKERVRQIENRALDKLKDSLLSMTQTTGLEKDLLFM